MPLQPCFHVPQCRESCRTRVPCANTRPTSTDSSKPTSPSLHANDTCNGHRTVLPYASHPIGIVIPHAGPRRPMSPTNPTAPNPSAFADSKDACHAISTLHTEPRAGSNRAGIRQKAYLRGHGNPLLHTPGILSQCGPFESSPPRGRLTTLQHSRSLW